MQFSEAIKLVLDIDVLFVELCASPHKWYEQGGVVVRIVDILRKRTYTMTTSNLIAKREAEICNLFMALLVRSFPAVVDSALKWCLYGAYNARKFRNVHGDCYPLDLCSWERWAHSAGMKKTLKPADCYRVYANATESWKEFYSWLYPMLFESYAVAGRNGVIVNGHAKFVMHNIDGTVTARTTITIPEKRKYWTPHISEKNRAAVTPLPDCSFIYADYSAAEIISLAAESKDKQLLAKARKGVIYDELASDAWGRTEEHDRQNAKLALIEFIYGASNETIANMVKLSRTDVEKLINAFVAAYPVAMEWVVACIESGNENNMVQTRFGRVMALDSQHKAVNYHLQSVTADWNKVAMGIAQVALGNLPHGKSHIIAHMYDGYLIQAERGCLYPSQECLRHALTKQLGHDMQQWGYEDFLPACKMRVMEKHWS